MKTLKEAIESGKRWRHKDWYKDSWAGPGSIYKDLNDSIIIEQAASLNFEIEPEPEKPREYHIHACAEHGAIRIGDDFCLSQRVIRVHDADACDRLHKGENAPIERHDHVIPQSAFTRWIILNQAWTEKGPGAYQEFWLDDGSSLKIKRGT